MIDFETEYREIEKARLELKTCKSYYRRRDLNKFIYRKQKQVAEAKAHLRKAKGGAIHEC